MSSFGDKQIVVAVVDVVETSRMNLLQRCLRLDRIFPSWTRDDDDAGDNRDAQRGRWDACAEFQCAEDLAVMFICWTANHTREISPTMCCRLGNRHGADC